MRAWRLLTAEPTIAGSVLPTVPVTAQAPHGSVPARPLPAPGPDDATTAALLDQAQASGATEPD